MKKWKSGFVLVLICICYGLTTLYSAYFALSKSRPQHQLDEAKQAMKFKRTDTTPELRQFAIWDTCGLGIYLWKNILHGEITRYNLNNGWMQSSLEIDDFVIKYNLGYGLTPDQALTPSQPNVVLVVNARNDALVPKAKSWLDHVLRSAYIKSIAIMLLGSETCENDWIQPYLLQKQITCVFIVYDSTLVDDEFVFQWPLGVASYRNFPNFDQGFLDLTAPRQYIFNFIGTVYKESSRIQMISAVDHSIDNATKKYIKSRDDWVAEEDSESMMNYQHVLLESDLTLSPTGRNSECYRTYEAMELGSIPVIEDVLTEGSCDYATLNQTDSSPYRLLKKYKSPVIFIKNWEKELPAVIEKYETMSREMKVRLRIKLIRWYVDFKTAMKEKFLAIIRDKFFSM